MNNKRPLAPHLQIYKPQLTSILSITHRFTGVVLSLFSILIPFSLLFISLGSDYYLLFLKILDHILLIYDDNIDNINFKYCLTLC